MHTVKCRRCLFTSPGKIGEKVTFFKVAKLETIKRVVNTKINTSSCELLKLIK